MNATRQLLGKASLGAAAMLAGVLAYTACPVTATAAAWKPPRIGHVFVINLENKGFATTFGADSPAPYLAKTLRAKGNLLTQYYGTAHNSLGNYIAQISGQAPNFQTQADCPLFTNFVGLPKLGPYGQAIGTGCVYPANVKTIADQLTAAGKTWRGYLQDMGNTPSRESPRCGHPALNRVDHTQSATAADQYATRHNPFAYFHSLLDPGACAANDVPLSSLPHDLARVATTRNLSYITPDLCNDAHDAPCADGRPGGLVSANAWLRTWVPRILHSPAFRKDGLLVITFDESDGPQSDASACCGEGPGPNTPLPGITGLGGGRVGALVLSRWVKPGSTTPTAYNHYSLLASLEDLFHLPHLGYASKPGLPRFGRDVYTAT